MLLRLEVALHRKYLSYVQVILAEEVVIEVHELCLSHGGEELTLLYRVEHVVNLQFLPAACHGA